MSDLKNHGLLSREENSFVLRDMWIFFTEYFVCKLSVRDFKGHTSVRLRNSVKQWSESCLLKNWPALKDYIPIAATNDEAKRHNSSLPGMGR